MRIDRTTLARLPPVDAAAQLGAAVQLGDLAIDDALTLAKDLRFPEEIQAALARAIAPPPGATAASLRAGFFVPVPGKNYRIEAPKHVFDVRFGARLARVMLAEGLKIDRATGVILDARGKPDPRCPVHLARQIFVEQTGREAPPWILLHPNARSFYWPTGQLELELGAQTIVPREVGGVKFVFTHRFDDTQEKPRVWRASELAPLPADTWRPKVEHAFGVRFEAENAELLEKAQILFERIVGPSAAKFPERERELLAEAGKLIEAPKNEAWTADDFDAVRSMRLDELARALAPVQVIVVPKNKHYSAMPQVAHIRKALQERGTLGDAATLVLQDPSGRGYQRLVLIAEDDLLAGGRDAKHELYHLLEDRYLSPDVVAQIDAAWARTVRKGGIFARAYGMQREEFFTTMSEEYEGAHGEEGRAWLRSSQRELWGIFENLARRLLS